MRVSWSTEFKLTFFVYRWKETTPNSINWNTAAITSDNITVYRSWFFYNQYCLLFLIVCTFFFCTLMGIKFIRGDIFIFKLLLRSTDFIIAGGTIQISTHINYILIITQELIWYLFLISIIFFARVVIFWRLAFFLIDDVLTNVISLSINNLYLLKLLHHVLFLFLQIEKWGH